MGMYLLQSRNKIIEEELPLPLRLSNIRASITYGKYNWELRKHLFFHLVKSSSSLALSLDTASMMSSHSSALALSSSPGSLSSHSLPIERNGRLSPLCGSQSKLPRILSSPAETWCLHIDIEEAEVGDIVFWLSWFELDKGSSLGCWAATIL